VSSGSGTTSPIEASALGPSRCSATSTRFAPASGCAAAPARCSSALTARYVVWSPCPLRNTNPELTRSRSTPRTIASPSRLKRRSSSARESVPLSCTYDSTASHNERPPSLELSERRATRSWYVRSAMPNMSAMTLLPTPCAFSSRTRFASTWLATCASEGRLPAAVASVAISTVVWRTIASIKSVSLIRQS
jgi:hypothetical protein